MEKRSDFPSCCHLCRSCFWLVEKHLVNPFCQAQQVFFSGACREPATHNWFKATQHHTLHLRSSLPTKPHLHKRTFFSMRCTQIIWNTFTASNFFLSFWMFFGTEKLFLSRLTASLKNNLLSKKIDMELLLFLKMDFEIYVYFFKGDDTICITSINKYILTEIILCCFSRS